MTKRYPGVTATAGVSCAFLPGEIHVLLGENGAGKSTCVALLSGLVRPDEGHVEVAGRRVAFAAPRESIAAGIATVFQHSMLVPTLRVDENLVLGAPWWQRPGRAALEARIARLRAAFGLRVPLDARAGDLSLGEQQQVEIARALLRDARVLILDEATSMLTPQGAEELGQQMRRLSAEGLAVLFITHKLAEAQRFGDRVTVLRQGRVAGAIAPQDLGAMGAAEAVDAMVRLMFGGGNAAAAPHRARVPGEVRLAAEGLATLPATGVPGLADVSLALRAGEILGIAGIDGNGQKELAEALAGQRPLAAGRVVLDGRDVTRAGIGLRRRLGLRYLTDDRLAEGSVGAFPIAENAVLKEIGRPPYWTGGIERPAAIRDHAERLIRDFAVHAPGAATPIGRLSGGNIQKVLLGRELSGAARVVVFSKPTYGLDVQNIAASRQRIREIAARGMAVLLISTDLDELIELADRIAVMAGGRITGTLGNDGAEPGELRLALGRLMVDA